MSQPLIRPMTPVDVAAAAAAILRAEWGDRRTWFEFATTQPACRPLVADLDGEIVGTGVGTANGEAGWVGTIWVAPAHRGRGLGRRLTEAIVDDLEGCGCRTLLLVATDAGRPLYERLGFVVESHYRILEAPGLPAPVEVGSVRPLRWDDLAQLEMLDRLATGEDRRHAIERFAEPASTQVLDVGGEIRGFVIRATWGGGATVATEPADACCILDARRLIAGPSGRVRVGLLGENTRGLETLAVAGYRPVWSAPRLARGAPLDWRPTWIWGQFNHALG